MDNIYTPQTLAAVVRRTPDVPSFLKDLFFKDTKTFLTETVSFDIVKGRRTITPWVAPNSTAPLSQRTGVTTTTYKPAQKKEKRSITENDIKVRLAGEQPFVGTVSPEERAIQLLAQDTQELKDNLVRSQEVMAADVLFNGQAHIKGDGIDDVVDFNFTNKETLAGNARWGQSAAEIVANIIKWKKKCLKASGFNPNTLVMNSETLEVMLSDKKILALFDNRRTEMGLLQFEQMAEGAVYVGFMGGQIQCNVFTYDNYYVDPTDGQEKEMVATGKLLVASDMAKFTKLYGANTIIPGEGMDFVTYEGEYVMRRLVTRDPDAAFLELQSRPIYVPFDVDSYFVADVL